MRLIARTISTRIYQASHSQGKNLGGPQCPVGIAPGTPTQVMNLDSSILPFMNLWPAPDVEASGSYATSGGTAKSFNHPEQSIREDFGTLRADYILAATETRLPPLTPSMMEIVRCR